MAWAILFYAGLIAVIPAYFMFLKLCGYAGLRRTRSLALRSLALAIGAALAPFPAGLVYGFLILSLRQPGGLYGYAAGLLLFLSPPIFLVTSWVETRRWLKKRVRKGPEAYRQGLGGGAPTNLLLIGTACLAFVTLLTFFFALTSRVCWTSPVRA
jgi:hypothetical protein